LTSNIFTCEIFNVSRLSIGYIMSNLTSLIPWIPISFILLCIPNLFILLISSKLNSSNIANCFKFGNLSIPSILKI